MSEIIPTQQPLAERLGRLSAWSKHPGVRLPIFAPVPLPPPAKPTVVDGGAEPLASPLVDERKPGSVPLHRLAFLWRSGAYWSYPYSLIGLIDCPAPNCLVIHCNCSEFDFVEIKGVGLDRLLFPLSEHRIASLREVDNLRFADGDFVIQSITAHTRKKKKPRLQAETGLWEGA